MGAGASIPIEKWSAYRLAAYSNEKSLPIYITKIIDKQQLNGATILKQQFSKSFKNNKRSGILEGCTVNRVNL